MSKVPDSYKMIFIVRKDIKMKTGKTVSQCCHATLDLYKKVLTNKTYNPTLEKWEYTGQKKISVSCKDLKEMTKIQEKAIEMGIPNTMICDAGKTQVAEGTFTVLALYGEERKIKAFTGHLKLL